MAPTVLVIQWRFSSDLTGGAAELCCFGCWENILVRAYFFQLVMHELFSAVSGMLVPTFGWDGLDCVCFIEYEYYKNHKETERLCLCWLQDTNSVVSKKWSNSTVQLRLDQFLDKITHSTALWHALRHSVSPSISLFMNSERLPLAPSHSCLTIHFIFSFISVSHSFSLPFILVLHITGWLSQFKCITVWQTRTFISISCVALLASVLL